MEHNTAVLLDPTRVCAYCTKTMHVGRPGHGTTHGACDPCVAIQLADVNRTIPAAAPTRQADQSATAKAVTTIERVGDVAEAVAEIASVSAEVLAPIVAAAPVAGRGGVVGSILGILSGVAGLVAVFRRRRP